MLVKKKKVLHVRNKTPDDVADANVGRYPLIITAAGRFVTYWRSLQKLPNTL